jgi:hypothetical protein
LKFSKEPQEKYDTSTIDDGVVMMMMIMMIEA